MRPEEAQWLATGVIVGHTLATEQSKGALVGTVDFSIRTVRRLVVAGACSAALVIGLGAGPAMAGDQHSGGESPNDLSVDPGDPGGLAGRSVEAGSGGLPVTGSDVAGMVALGAAAVAVGSGAIVVSKRRARLST